LEVSGTVRWPGREPLVWQRSLRYNQLDDSWLILDRISGNLKGPVAWAFRFAPGLSLEPVADDGVRVRFPQGAARRIRFEPVGEVVIETGYVAPAYGARVEAPVLRHRTRSAESRTWILPD
jgi:hypothetical protein